MGRELEEEEAAWFGKELINARDLSRRRQTCGPQDAQNLLLRSRKESPPCAVARGVKNTRHTLRLDHLSRNKLRSFLEGKLRHRGMGMGC